jgi:hypothetical protein
MGMTDVLVVWRRQRSRCRQNGDVLMRRQWSTRLEGEQRERWEQRMRSSYERVEAHNLMFVEISGESNKDSTHVSSIETRSPYM